MRLFLKCYLSILSILFASTAYGVRLKYSLSPNPVGIINKGNKSKGSTFSLGSVFGFSHRFMEYLDIDIVARRNYGIEPKDSGKDFAADRGHYNTTDFVLVPRTHYNLTPAIEFQPSFGVGYSLVSGTSSGAPNGTSVFGSGLILIPGVGLQFSSDAKDPDATAYNFDFTYSIGYQKVKKVDNTNLGTKTDISLFSTLVGISCKL